MQVAWGVEINPSLHRAAETLYRWRQEGRRRQALLLHPPRRGLLLRWFGPREAPEDFLGEKSFLDARFSLFSRAADDYLAVCRGLDPSLTPGGSPTPPGADWPVLRERGVSVVVLYDPDPAHVLPVLGRLYDDPAEWTLLSVDGQASIVGWNPVRPDRFVVAVRPRPARLRPGR